MVMKNRPGRREMLVVIREWRLKHTKTEISSNRLDPGFGYIFKVLFLVLHKTFLWQAYNADEDCKETVCSKRFAPFLIVSELVKSGGPVRYTERILVTNLDSQRYNQYKNAFQ